jgi:hypothetical protein
MAKKSGKGGGGAPAPKASPAPAPKASVQIKEGKTVASPKALATQLLGGKKKAEPEKVKALTQKIKKLNNITKKGQDLVSGDVIKIGRVKTAKFGSLKTETAKFSRVLPAPQMPISFGSGSSSASPASALAAYAAKSAIPDYILLKNEDIPIEFLSDLLLENIGGQEIIGITRNDLINGQNVSYQPIRNAQAIYQQYNPLKIISVNDTSKNFFDGFSINILDYVPNVGNGPAPDFPYAYVDQASGDLIVNTVNVSGNLKVEVQISRTARVFDDTIYGEEL